MKIIFFKIPKPKKYNYKPVYYNEDTLEQKISENKYQNISQKYKDNYLKRREKRLKKVSNIRLIIILIILILLFFYFLFY